MFERSHTAARWRTAQTKCADAWAVLHNAHYQGCSVNTEDRLETKYQNAWDARESLELRGRKEADRLNDEYEQIKAVLRDAVRLGLPTRKFEDWLCRFEREKLGLSRPHQNHGHLRESLDPYGT